jgi:excinuclease ABC subunit A
MDIIKSADYILDIGPEGGVGGGQLVAKGTPEEVANNKNSYTGQYLKKVLRLVRNKEGK